MVDFYFRPANGLLMTVKKLFDKDFCFIWQERAYEKRERLRVESGKDKAYELLYWR